MAYEDLKNIKDRVSAYPNRRKLTIISQTKNEIIADIEREDSPTEEGTQISSTLIKDIVNEVETLRTQITQARGSEITENGNYKETYEMSIKADVKNSYGGANIGSESSAEKGGSVGYNAMTSDGFAGGFNAKTISGDTKIDAIQLGNGTNSTSKSLQVYNDNIYNSNTHTLTVENLKVGEKDLWEIVYPVGAVFISISSTSPATLFGGQWEELPSNCTLWTTPTNESTGGQTIPAGLPNIKGKFKSNGSWQGVRDGAFEGALYNLNDYNQGLNGENKSNAHGFGFNAHLYNSIYRDDVNTVQPPAVRIYAWKRIQ